MIWLRLFIALIALTISSDLSAWAAPMQVNSPEGPYDCKGVANGANIRDRNKTLCCLQGQQVCEQCFYTKQGCEPQFGCDTLAKKDIYGTCCFDNQKDCGKCYYTKQGCERQNGCGNTAEAQCGGCNLGNTAASYACRKCGDNTSCLGCDGVPFSGKVNTNCGCGKPAAGPCGCSACPPPVASCNHAPVKFTNRNLISLHFGTGNNDSNGVLSDAPQYREICKNALGASSYDAVVYYDIHEAKFKSPGNNSICSYKPNSSTEKHCPNAGKVGNPKHISQISCKCK